MRFLVTGATGSVGCRLVERLAAEHGPGRVTAVAGPPGDPREDSRLPRLRAAGVRVVAADLLGDLAGKLPEAETIFHCAANLRTDVTRESEDPTIRVNDTGVARLLDALGESPRGRVFVHASSIAVGDRWADGTPRTLYGVTKLRSEGLVLERARRQGLRAVILRLGTVYGPDVRAGHVFEIVTRHVREGTWAGRVRWPGRVSLVHIDDAVELMLRAAEDPGLEGRPVFLASPEEVTIAGWMDAIADALGRPRPAVAPPGWVFSLVRGVCGIRSLWPLLPSRLAWLAWRASLITGDGFRCDGSALDRLLPRGYLPYREGVARSLAPGAPGERVCA